jgi:ribokinase
MMGAGVVCCLHSAADAAKNLADKFETVIVTAGGQGMAAWGANDEDLRLPAEKVKVISSHGAGDSFIGTLAAKLASGQGLEQACGAASSAAARHVAGN